MCFYVLSVMINAAIDICGKYLSPCFPFLGYNPRSGVIGHVVALFNFMRNPQAAFPQWLRVLTSQQQQQCTSAQRVHSLACFPPFLPPIVAFIIAVLAGVQWSPTVL